jgi:hypothetical protein
VILESEEDEMILGLDLLTTLGINVENQLQQLAASDATEQDDPIEFEDDERTEVQDKAELMRAIEDSLKQALENGFPAELIGELKRIVFLYDIWRLALGRDPPARVPPLKIKLRDGAKPYRCRPRAYPPHLRKFMKDFNEELERMGWIKENQEA